MTNPRHWITDPEKENKMQVTDKFGKTFRIERSTDGGGNWKTADVRPIQAIVDMFRESHKPTIVYHDNGGRVTTMWRVVEEDRFYTEGQSVYDRTFPDWRARLENIEGAQALAAHLNATWGK